ncbi:TPA: SH3 domain-containing protein [Pseudomonas putida]|uniref:SH3 domain-containing protein n=1 Tax=Pseudomonas TaxID=286 RepID=UPI0004842C26|nr:MULTISPECIES: SH3 domain-containing protein [Pseudomonas]MDD2150634.1 SH3 domain-containing protein [Pseudomonas putida]RAS31744.1 outer membrane protein with glycine zipper [Pseudomonas sp. URMO17WK12:I7]SMF58303.1 Predicted outer membrane lipoprotein [Pseudomonas sp. URMO17WK12:I5]HDS1679046.1 SH3 domain-containing protein [Pseudomonas putida]
MRKKFVASLLAVAIASTTACAQLGISKEQAGTVIGGLAGVAIGSTLGSGNGKIAAALIAGGIGAYVGNRIGHHLDEKDQQALALRTQEVLSQPATASAQPVTWKSDHSGATAQITPGKEYTKTQQVQVKRAPKIQAVPSMKLINEPYVTISDNLNVRAAPNPSGEKVGSLKNHTEFTAVGSTGDWVLVGRKGVTVGYVHKNYVEPKAQAVAKRVSPAVNLDDLDVAASKETQGFDLDSIQSLPTQTVAAEAACRPVTVSLQSQGGQTEQEQNTFCKQANGTWELI